MKIRLNLFHKIILLIIIVITVTLFLYGRFYQHNVKLITSQLVATNLDHLQFFAKQVDNNVDQLFTNAHTLFRDTTIQDYSEIESLTHLIDQNQTKLNVLNKLSLQTSSTNLIHHISVYNLATQEVLSSDSKTHFNEGKFNHALPDEWTYTTSEQNSSYNKFFRFYITHSSDLLKEPHKANAVMEIKLSTDEITKMLNQYQSPYSGDIFFYNKNTGMLANSNFDSELGLALIDQIDAFSNGESISTTIKHEGKRYIVNSAWSSSLRWHVVHISPLELFLQPLESSRSAFVLSSIMLLILSILMSFLLYKQVHRPIHLLLRAVNQLKEGRWSYRIQLRSKNEFAVLNEAFNEMASQIQQLIERVYLEQLRVKDAYLKQLQSQINPHFLYNCLFFIKSKASVEDYEAITKMSINLGEYYRYITKLDHSNTTIEQELNLLKNYLSVQNLRKQRIQYNIDVPNTMLGLQIPRLLIQPIVENSIIHGIEKIAGIGIISITGKIEGIRVFISVEDNGPGMNEADIAALNEKINQPDFSSTGGYGLWNVQQRIKQIYGIYSGLIIEQSASGGVKVTLRLDRNEG